MQITEKYLSDLAEIRSTGAGTPETSYYTPLANLMNAVGKHVQGDVRCIMQLSNRGAGLPDGGLFTASQVRKVDLNKPAIGQVPERGVIEVKPAHNDTWAVARAEQVTRYWKTYRLVLVTNYWHFVLVGTDAGGHPVVLETFKLAESERDFWEQAQHPRKLAKDKGKLFEEYLTRVLLHTAPLTDPKTVAEFMASYARDALTRLELTEHPALDQVRAALEQALGLHFSEVKDKEKEKAEHFFRSSLVQTLFYGLFSAWMLWSRRQHADSRERFEWRLAADELQVPVIRNLYHLLAEKRQLEQADLYEVLNWAAEMLNRVDRAAFTARFDEGKAVQYFYEPFLEAFDPELRKELGVWYTPPEIVHYMVERVDRVLREELKVEDGLADPNVFVLDPCCGTGAYLVEVLKRIETTLREQGQDALIGLHLKQAMMERVFGFEILPAPFVIAHIQVSLALQKADAPLDEQADERAGIYLTNALTGWEPPKDPKQHFVLIDELRKERDAANTIKRDKKILVVLGNPPYDGYASIPLEEESQLIAPYKKSLKSWGITRNYLQDLYVRFFRLGERRIAEKTKEGIVCYISNFSYLRELTYVVMRQHLLQSFDDIWIDCLNGDSRETGKRTPDGQPDPSIFSTEFNPAGIRKGTAIFVAVCKPRHKELKRVLFRHFWGTTKRTDLIASLKDSKSGRNFEKVEPTKETNFQFYPGKASSGYLAWPSVVELSRTKPLIGPNENRGGNLFDISRALLEKRMVAYFDENLTWSDYAKLGCGLTEDRSGFEPEQIRQKATNAEEYSADRLFRYVVRPFDTRWCYVTMVPHLWNRPRPTFWPNIWEGNRFLLFRPRAAASPEGIPAFYSKHAGEQDTIRGHAYFFPFYLKKHFRFSVATKPDLLTSIDTEIDDSQTASNLSLDAEKYLERLDCLVELDSAATIWYHVLAICYAPAYLTENKDGVQLDWPRVPLPDSKERLLASAELGKQLAALLDPEESIMGITEAPRSEFKTLGILRRTDSKSVSPRDLAVTAGWGHFGKDDVVMPGSGKSESRSYTADEWQNLLKTGLDENSLRALLGKNTLDIYLNDTTYWSNVPEHVWEYVIGGYQVIKKWLSYREEKILGRALSLDEAEYVSQMIRRIAAILLLQPQLDENYQAVKSTTWAWNIEVPAAMPADEIEIDDS